MRLFVAIDLPAPARAAVAAATAPLRALSADVLRWVPAENLHLTLAFLGEMPEDSLPGLGAALTAAGRTAVPFQLRLGGVGAFPELARPRVVWVGVEAPPELGRLHRQVEAALAPLGYAPERRPFRPHLTVARVKGRGARPVPGLAEEAGKVDAGTSLTVNEMVLMSSVTGPHGARYQRRHVAPLGR